MKLVQLCLVIFVVLGLVACAAQPNAVVVSKVVEVTPSPLFQLDVCFSAPSGTMAVAWYAFEKGLFKKYGLDINLVYISSGSKAVSAMIAGDVDFCQVSGPAVVSAAVAGEDLVMIGGLFNTYVYSLMVTPDIKTPEDLRGKAVAISQAGGSSDTAMREALKSMNLKPDEDVAILAVGGQAERLAAMETGAVAGTVVSVPESVEAKEMGYQVLLDMSKLGTPYQHTGIATSKSFIKDNRQVAVNFMKAISEAIAMMKEDKEGTMQVMAEYLLLDVEEDEASLTEAHEVLIKGYLPQAPYPTLEGIQTELTSLQAENPAAASFKPENVVDLSIVQELEKSGFISALYQ
jgi:NitT/TauT family transport system substrate-binding protein